MIYRLSSQYLIPQESVIENQEDSPNRKQKMYTYVLVLSFYRAGINNYSKCHFYSHIFQDFHIIVGWGPPCGQSWTPCVISFLKHSLPQGKWKSQIKF